MLICMIFPHALQLFTSIGTLLLGTIGLSVGSAFAFYLTIALATPLMIASLPEHLIFTPSWQTNLTGALFYKQHSSHTQIIHTLHSLSTNAVVAIHAFVAASALIGFTGVAIFGLLINKVKTFYSPKRCTKEDLQVHIKNINHANSFKIFLGKLIIKLQNGTTEASDNELLSILYQSQWGSEKKQMLADYIDTKIRDSAIAEKMPYIFAQKQMKFEPYLPSKKLIDLLHTELAEEQNVNVELKTSVERLHEVYTCTLSPHIGRSETLLR